MIKVDKMTYQYPSNRLERDEIEGKYAIKDISFEIKKGEFVAILGRNGSGKSTLARHLNALLKPSAGTLSVDQMLVQSEEDIWKIRKVIGMVFQNPDNQLIASIVEEDVAFGPENLKLLPEEIKIRVKKYLKLMGMNTHSKKSIEELSGGEKQKVIIAGILAMEPAYCVLDEPTSMLDPIARKEILQALLQIQKTCNTTIILVTHHMEEVLDADRVIIMEKGTVGAITTPKELFADASLMKKFQLEPPYVVQLVEKLKEKGINFPKQIATKEELIKAICQLY